MWGCGRGRIQRASQTMSGIERGGLPRPIPLRPFDS